MIKCTPQIGEYWLFTPENSTYSFIIRQASLGFTSLLEVPWSQIWNPLFQVYIRMHVHTNKHTYQLGFEKLEEGAPKK